VWSDVYNFKVFADNSRRKNRGHECLDYSVHQLHESIGMKHYTDKMFITIKRA
jgi:hypothetical protein